MPNFALVCLLSIFPMLSTDMYLPAVPTLQKLWGIPLSQANLSLVLFFLFYSLFLLVHGPLSDRVGRRPVLLGGIGLFIVGSVCSAAADGIGTLVAARIVQAVGASAASALALALVKDLYEDSKQKRVLAYVGVIMPLCPMIAPTLGSWLLRVLSWRWIFLSQASLALAGLYGSWRLKEPLTELRPGGLLATFAAYAALARNRRYITYVFCFSSMGLAIAGYLGASADVYINHFGLDERHYGLLFGLNAFGFMCGSLACSRLCAGLSSRRILLFTLTGMVAAGGGLMALASGSVWQVTLPMLAYTFCFGMSRPISNHMVLSEVEQDVGTAASLMTFCSSIVNVVAMWTISLDGPPKVLGWGAMAFLSGFVPLATVFLPFRRVRPSAT